jgi:lysophospholipase L1-like esterase
MRVICISLLLFVTATLVVGAPIDPAQFSAPVRVACIGDSITAGSGTSPGHAYPAQLQKLLGKHWLVRNFGVSARTLLRKGDFPYWKERAFTNALNSAPDVVIILLGTNDSKPQNWQYGSNFITDYTDFIKTFLNLPKKPIVFICDPPPVPEPGNYGINEAAVGEEIPIINQIATEYKLDVIDMHKALEGKPQFLPDRVHPNNEGAQEMARAAFRALTGTEPIVSK